jgi:hypothetical protein
VSGQIEGEWWVTDGLAHHVLVSAGLGVLMVCRRAASLCALRPWLPTDETCPRCASHTPRGCP